MRKGTIYVALSGHRKPTSIYCLDCGAWHETHRGLDPPAHPFHRQPRPETVVVIRSARASASRRVSCVLPGLVRELS